MISGRPLFLPIYQSSLALNLVTMTSYSHICFLNTSTTLGLIPCQLGRPPPIFRGPFAQYARSDALLHAQNLDVPPTANPDFTIIKHGPGIGGRAGDHRSSEDFILSTYS
jgi:hypothetical protein